MTMNKTKLIEQFKKDQAEREKLLASLERTVKFMEKRFRKGEQR